MLCAMELCLRWKRSPQAGLEPCTTTGSPKNKFFLVKVDLFGRVLLSREANKKSQRLFSVVKRAENM